MPELGTFEIDNMPVAAQVWAELGSSFSNIAQPFCELMDNPLSNFCKNRGDPRIVPVIRVLVRNLSHEVEITVEDGGTGIENLDNALTLAGQAARESVWNEHGYGLKHALAYLDANQGHWTVTTRTEEDARRGRCRQVKGPYAFGNGVLRGSYHLGWIGTLGRTGTVIRLTCPMTTFTTLNPNGRKKMSFQELMLRLKEHLCHTYARILERGEVRIELAWEDGTARRQEVLTPLFPVWLEGTLVELPPQTYDLGGGDITLECRYGLIRGSRENYDHYTGNMESSGVEISINDRVIERGLMKESWGKGVHPSQNQFLVQVNLKTNCHQTLPATKTAKNGFREEHPYRRELFKWIRSTVQIPEECNDTREKRLFKQLAEKMRKEPDVTRVSLDERAYGTLGLQERIDLLVCRRGKVSIYEGKARNAKGEDLYQLMKSWNGCIVDGVPAEEGILIAKVHTDSARQMLAHARELTGLDGRPYNFRLVTWADEGIMA